MLVGETAIAWEVAFALSLLFHSICCSLARSSLLSWRISIFFPAGGIADVIDPADWAATEGTWRF